MPRLHRLRRPRLSFTLTVRRFRVRATSGLTGIGFWTARGTFGAMDTGRGPLIGELPGPGHGIGGAGGTRATGAGKTNTGFLVAGLEVTEKSG